MTARTVAAIATGEMAVILLLPDLPPTALYIIPIAPRPAPQALPRYIVARQDMERISTGMATEKHANETYLLPRRVANIGARRIK